jgi:hypothetical protein
MRGAVCWTILMSGAAWLLAWDRLCAAPPLLPARTRPVAAKTPEAPATATASAAAPAKPKPTSGTGPYEAVVLEDDVTVRCGPGRKYYPTSKLRTGDRVKVVRHDPGGWFVIEPPEGSFSWVPARAIDKQPDGRGVVTVSQVTVRAGSYESDIRDIESRPLRKGESVRVTGEKLLAEANGQRELWYRIVPPKYERRWVLGQFVVPADQRPSATGANIGTPVAQTSPMPVKAERPGASDPFLDAEQSAGPIVQVGAELDELPGPRTTLTPERIDDTDTLSHRVSLAPPSVEDATPVEGDAVIPPIPVEPLPNETARREGALTPDVAEAELRRLDAKLRTIVEEECVLWEFTGVRAEFEGLLAENPPEEAVEHIRSRLAQIQTWERKRNDVLELRRMALLVERRDRELADKLKGSPPRETTEQPAPPADNPVAKPPEPAPQPPTAPQVSAPTAATKPELPMDGRVLFVGAGLVELSPAQRPAQAPAYRLITPQGRFLAWLKPEAGFDLAKWVGKPAGLLGRRQFDAQLQGDLIEVNGASSVRLSNGPPTKLTPPVR